MAFNLLGISIPTPSLPNPFASKPSGGGTGGRSGGGFKPPSLPKVTIPKFTPPKVSVPKFTPPKVELPKLPPVSIPKIELPKIAPPKVEIPKPLTDAGGAVSRGLDSVIRARDQTYEQGAVNIVAGNRAVGVGQYAGATAADVMLPMDVVNVGNKLLTGRGGELTGEDYLWAGVDAIGLAASPFTLGASYAVTRAVKGAKVAAKGAKAVKTVEGVGEMGKFSGAIKAARTAARTAAKSTKAKMPKMPSIGRPKGPKMPSIGRPKGPKTRAPPKQPKRKQPKQKQPKQQKSAIPETTKVPDAPKQGALTKVGRYVPAAAGLGVMGLTLGGMLGGGGGGAPPEEDPYGGQDDYPWWMQDDYPWWMQDYYGGNEPYPYGYDEEGYPYPDEEGYYPAGYPDPLGLEGYGQDACEYLEELPGIGGVYEEAARRGLGLPAIIGTVLIIILIIVFLRSKKGKQMIGNLKKKITGKGGK